MPQATARRSRAARAETKVLAPCADPGKGENPGADSALARLVDETGAACNQGLAKGLGGGAALPADTVSQLAHMVWEAKMSAWTSAGVAEQSMRALSPLAGLNDVLERVFGAMTQFDIGGVQNLDSKNAGLIANVEVGLTLAAMCLDASSLPGVRLNSVNEVASRAALDFVLRHAQTTFNVACAALSDPSDRPAGAQKILSAAATRLATGFARVLRSAHHFLAAVHYAPPEASYRLVPVAAHCLAAALAAKTSAGTSLATLAVAAADLLVALAGMAEGPLQQAALDECLRVAAAPGAAAQRRRGGARPHEVGLRAATVVRALSVACLPVRLDSVTDRQKVLEAALGRYTTAEARAGAMVTEILKRTLLEAPSESGAWSSLEAFVHELLCVCGDPRWGAAPLLLLCFAKGLVQIARASRSVEITWAQREFAVKVLTEVCGPLCRGYTAVSKYAASADVQSPDLAAIRRFVAPAHGQDAQPESAPTEFKRLLITYLTKIAGSPAAMVPPPAACEQGGGRPPLQASALPADDARHNCIFILCGWAVQALAATARAAAPPAPKKRSRNGAQQAFTPRSPAGQDEDAVWALTGWSDYARIDPPSGSVDARIGHEAVAPCVARLYQQALFANGEGLLSRARLVVLEAFLELLGGSPLAHVRRQAVLGLGAACEADGQLIASRCFAEALAAHLQDDSALVRLAVMDLISRLPQDLDRGPFSQRVHEFREIVRSRLADASKMVRYAAFRIACASVRLEDAKAARNVADLLQRIRHEGDQVRGHVLKSLEGLLLTPPHAKAALERLMQVVVELGASDQALRDLFKTHRAAHDPQTFAVSMKSLADTIVSQLLTEKGQSPDAKSLSMLLEHISAECPGAVHAHIATLQRWMVLRAGMPKCDLLLAKEACRVLSNALPSWVEQTSASLVQPVGQNIQDLLSKILESQELGLVRAATECLCIVAPKVLVNTDQLLEHFSRNFAQLRDVVEQRLPLDAPTQERVCRLAWIVASMLEFVDAGVLPPEAARVCGGQHPKGLVGAVLWLLCTFCLNGPPAMRPLLVPCVGFVLRHHAAFLHAREGPYKVLEAGLIGGGAGGAAVPALTLRTMETLASLLEAYQKQAECGAPGTAADDSVVSEAVNTLGGLQGPVLAALKRADTPHEAGHGFSALETMWQLGVLHQASALPSLTALSLTGFQAVARAARQLLLRLAEAGPEGVAGRLGAGLQEAAQLLSCHTVALGSTAKESWRFAAICEAYVEHMDSRPLRERFLDALIADVTGLGARPPAAGAADEEAPRNTLLHAELALGLLCRVPFRGEAEVSRVLHAAAQHLTLRALPLLPQHGEDAAGSPSPAATLGVCTSCVLLHRLCEEWARLVDARRLLRVADGVNIAAEQPLPTEFIRRPHLDLSPLLAKLLGAATARGGASKASEALLTVLAESVPANSWLLRGTSGGRRRSGRGRPANREPAARAGAGATQE